MTIYKPRDYQQLAHDRAIEHAKKSLESQVIVLPCGAGKSVVVSMLAKTLHEMSGKKILCTAPNKKLILQNHAKYSSYGFLSSVLVKVIDLASSEAACLFFFLVISFQLNLCLFPDINISILRIILI